MVKIRIKRGLNLPLKGEAEIRVEEALDSKTIALDISPFSRKIRVRATVKEGDTVKIGDQLAFDPHFEKRIFSSPASGKIEEIIRGDKRRILSMIIAKDDHEEVSPLEPLSEDILPEAVIDALFSRGASPFILERPFNQMISESRKPRAIFINAVSSAPLAPSPEIHLEGESVTFQKGINFLSKIAPCHLVSRGVPFDSFKSVTHHTIKGPHPAGLSSVHIEKISPLQSADDCVWTVEVNGVITVGAVLGEGRYHLKRKVAVTGLGLEESGQRLCHVRWGGEIDPIVEKYTTDNTDRIVAGDVLTGKTKQRHIGFFDNQISALPKYKRSRLLSFMRIFTPYYSAHKSYLSFRKHNFSPHMHGEQRPIVNGSLYQKVMPMNIPVEAFIKAIMAKDYEMAIQLGLLHVVPEDFALCEFICPSKMPLTEIVERGIEEYLELNR